MYLHVQSELAINLFNGIRGVHELVCPLSGLSVLSDTVSPLASSKAQSDSACLTSLVATGRSSLISSPKRQLFALLRPLQVQHNATWAMLCASNLPGVDGSGASQATVIPVFRLPG